MLLRLRLRSKTPMLRSSFNLKWSSDVELMICSNFFLLEFSKIDVVLVFCQATDGITVISTSYLDGVISCRFQRSTNVTTNDKIYDFDQMYYLMLATGPFDDSGLFNFFFPCLNSVSKWKYILLTNFCMKSSMNILPSEAFCRQLIWLY